MTLVTIDLQNAGYETGSDDRVVFYSPANRNEQGTIISTAETSVPLVDGQASKELAPGPVVVQIIAQGVADTRPKSGYVPEEGPVPLWDVILDWTPALVDQGILAILEAVEDALGQVSDAVAAEVDAIKWLKSRITPANTPDLAAVADGIHTVWSSVEATGLGLPVAGNGTVESVTLGAIKIQTASLNVGTTVQVWVRSVQAGTVNAWVRVDDNTIQTTHFAGHTAPAVFNRVLRVNDSGHVIVDDSAINSSEPRQVVNKNYVDNVTSDLRSTTHFAGHGSLPNRLVKTNTNGNILVESTLIELDEPRQVVNKEYVSKVSSETIVSASQAYSPLGVVAVPLGRSRGNLTLTNTTFSARVPIGINAPTTGGVRVGFLNRDMLTQTTYSGNVTITGVYIGEGAVDSEGNLTGDFIRNPTPITTTPYQLSTDGETTWTGWSVPWYKITKNTLISYGIVTDGLPWVYGHGHCWRTGDASDAGLKIPDTEYSGINSETPHHMHTPLLPTVELKTRVPRVLVVGDSHMVGVNADMLVTHAPANLAGGYGFQPSVMAIGGSRLSGWANVDGMWDEINEREYDRAYIALGSNDIWGGGTPTLSNLQTWFKRVCDRIRETQGAIEIIAGEVWPRNSRKNDPDFDDVMGVCDTFNAWLNTLPHGITKAVPSRPLINSVTKVIYDQYVADDGVHLNAVGCEVVASQLSEYLLATPGYTDTDISSKGQPQGDIVAKPGTRYTDTETSNGAVRWVKMSGTGNTGWVVEFGDTGPINISLPTHLGGSGAYVSVARSNANVTLTIHNSIALEDIEQWTTLFTLPDGFSPPNNFRVQFKDAYLEIRKGGQVVVVDKVLTDSIVSGATTFYTSSLWPTT